MILLRPEAQKGEKSGFGVELGKPGGLYVIDDMLPQPNWPEGHAEKVKALLRTLHALPGWHVTQMDWASGVVVAVRAQMENLT